eukprot:6187989-Pleurochrysis_carterae.AAC.1
MPRCAAGHTERLLHFLPAGLLPFVFVKACLIRAACLKCYLVSNPRAAAQRALTSTRASVLMRLICSMQAGLS